MKIGALQKTSLIDYPGEICAIVFTVGCNFRCPYCHNPELVRGSIKDMDMDGLFDFLKKRAGKLSAVSITGGEPTIHSDLIDFIKEIRLLGYEKIKLDTNGTNPKILEELIQERLVTYIAMDIKAPLDRYGAVTGYEYDIGLIEKSIDIIKNSRIDYEFRTTVIEGFVEKEDVLLIADLIKGAKAYYIQRFIPSKALNESFLSKRSISNEELDEIRQKIGKMFDIFEIR